MLECFYSPDYLSVTSLQYCFSVLCLQKFQSFRRWQQKWHFKSLTGSRPTRISLLSLTVIGKTRNTFVTSSAVRQHLWVSRCLVLPPVCRLLTFLWHSGNANSFRVFMSFGFCQGDCLHGMAWKWFFVSCFYLFKRKSDCSICLKGICLEKWHLDWWSWLLLSEKHIVYQIIKYCKNIIFLQSSV